MENLEKLHTIVNTNFSASAYAELENLLGGEKNMVGQGSSRKVYRLNGDFVAKIPLFHKYASYNEYSICNLREYLIFKTVPKVPLANCFLLFYKMIPIIVMESLDADWSKTKNLYPPKGWAGKLCDGFQGGLSRDGRYLSYDVGYERKLLANEGKDFTPTQFNKLAKGNPQFLRFLKKDMSEPVQQCLVLV
jgi:hypothetical protein